MEAPIQGGFFGSLKGHDGQNWTVGGALVYCQLSPPSLTSVEASVNVFIKPLSIIVTHHIPEHLKTGSPDLVTLGSCRCSTELTGSNDNLDMSDDGGV